MDVAHSVLPGLVLVEQGVGEDGSPCGNVRMGGEVVRGDVVCRTGRYGQWLYVDVAVGLDAVGVRDEAALVRKGGHRPLIAERINRGKQTPQSPGSAVLNSGGDFRPAGLSAFGVYDFVTQRSVAELAKAVDSHSSVPPPLGAPSTAARMLVAMTTAAIAGDAAFALRRDRGTLMRPWCVHCPLGRSRSWRSGLWRLCGPRTGLIRGGGVEGEGGRC